MLITSDCKYLREIGGQTKEVERAKGKGDQVEVSDNHDTFFSAEIAAKPSSQGWSNQWGSWNPAGRPGRAPVGFGDLAARQLVRVGEEHILPRFGLGLDRTDPVHEADCFIIFFGVVLNSISGSCSILGISPIELLLFDILKNFSAAALLSVLMCQRSQKRRLAIR